MSRALNKNLRTCSSNSVPQLRNATAQQCQQGPRAPAACSFVVLRTLAFCPQSCVPMQRRERLTTSHDRVLMDRKGSRTRTACLSGSGEGILPGRHMQLLPYVSSRVLVPVTVPMSSRGPQPFPSETHSYTWAPCDVLRGTR